VSGATGAGGNGQGGQGQSAGNGDPSSGPSADDPEGPADGDDPSFGDGDDVALEDDSDGGSGETIGKDQGASGSGIAAIPDSLRDDFTSVLERSTAQDRSGLSPSVADVVSRFFDLMAQLEE
jgi:hypothetical protein